MASISFKSLNKLRLQKTDYDVVFKIGAHKFPAHQMVLRARMEYFRDVQRILDEKLTIEVDPKIIDSTYFNAFLNSRMARRKYFRDCFTIEGKSIVVLDPELIDGTYFSDFLNYVYTFKIDFTNENFRTIHNTAVRFRFNELIDKVEEHMKSNMKMENVFYFRTLARELGFSKSFETVPTLDFQNLFYNMNELKRKKEISTLSYKHLNFLLEKLRENNRSKEMFRYSMDWILADEVNRSRMLLELLKNIPLENLSLDFLKAASHYELIRKDIECLKLLFDVLITALKSDVREKRKQRIDSLYAKYILYAIGGFDGDALSSVSQYNSTSREWTATTPMPTERSHFAYAVIGHKIYVCGGGDRKGETDELTVFDTYTRAWTELTPMKHERQICAAAVLNEQIYVAGGWNGTEVLSVVERHNVHTNQWSNVAPMITKRAGLELISLNGFLYAIGGNDGSDALNSVERYDPQADQWTPMNNTLNRYHVFGSVVLNNNIYIAGSDECEVYSSADDKWTEIPAPSECDSGRRLAVYDGQLYAIGGVVGPWKELKGTKTVEVFDIKARVWRPEPDMNIARCFHGVAVIKKSFFFPIKLAFDANESLNELRLQNTGCDIVLKVGGHEFPAHRKVLIARLDYFQNILTVQTKQENESVISLDLKITDSTYFGEVLNYIYTSKITFTTENIRSIYRTAEYFRFDELIYEMQDHLEFTVDIDNVRSYMSIAIELRLESLQRVFAQFIIQQIFPDINRCSKERFPSMLLSDNLNELLQKFKENGSIEDMFHYTVDWIAHDEVNRSEMLLGLLKNIPLKKLSSDFLIEVVAKNYLIRNNVECLNWLLNTITLPNSHNESREDSLYAIGGRDRKALSSVSEYNSTTCKWIATTPMPSRRSHFGCAVIALKIYICGGTDGERNLNSLTVFDTLTRTWKQLTPMKHARELCALAVLNRQIYVAGGWNGTDQLAVVERYNVQTDQWQDVAPMTIKRVEHELVALNGFLYAIGGHDGSDALNSVEQYDPQTDQWTHMNNTNNKYNSFGSAVLNDNIYIAGHKKCEVYNTAFKRWIGMPAPSECNYGRRLAVFNGKLYAIGGRVGEPEKWEEWKGSKTVEVFDFEERAWKPEPDIDVARCFHCVAVVKNKFLFLSH